MQAFDLVIQSTSENEDLNAALKQSLLLDQLDDEATPQDILAASQADYERLIGALYSEGYFGPGITIQIDGREAASIPPISPPTAIRTVVVRVTAGPRYRFGAASIAPVARGTELPDGFATNEVARTPVLRDTVDVAIERWRELGRAKAEVAGQEITARHPDRRLDARITLDTGPKLDFGDLVISGNEDVRTSRIRDIAGLPTGETFSPEELDRVTTRLRRTGTFRVVALSEADEIGPGNTLDINAQIIEEKPRRLEFGAEISTQEGISVSSAWMHRNLLGGAERLRFEFEIEGIGGDTGGEDFRFLTRFDRPATFNEDTDFYALTELERLDEVNFNSRQASVEMGIRRYASARREYTLGVGITTAETEDAFGNQSYTIFTVPMSATFDYRDNRLSATEGYYAQANLTPFLSIDGTDDGLRAYLDGRAYTSTGPDDRLTFAVRAQLGALSGPTVENAPSDFLFYSGGGGTVRGQDYQSLGIELPDDELIGGRSFLGLSGEIRARTGDNLSVVGFYDAGYVGPENFPDGSSGEWHSGAGIGLRYDTGIGPVRLDVGVPVSGPDDNTGFEIYIGIGQAF
ncbi:outer membrane protein assembly factor [Litoreibacter roseus]|uniref:Outer membrane protein assembly factor n=1 Tax=Litoreibacter roseus TaxID=2601869 RepID=A0A6N6JET7_9RHOB|nr:outer membrane protein assembly factor [Litoreibacter roseus]